MSFRPNQFRYAASVGFLGTFRDGKWQTFTPQEPVERILRGKPWLLRPGLTFSPYANPRSCNAHCRFCSEELLRRDASRLSAKTIIGDHDRYFQALSRAWDELRGFPMGMSLSGLEATSDPAWMLRLLSLIETYDDLFPMRVLYSNGTGLYTHDALIDALQRARFDRVELSRCHFDEVINQRLMRFDKDQPIRSQRAFAETVRRLQGRVPVKLSCIVNTQGVATLSDLEAYLSQAAALGVSTVVFRELSALGDAYVENNETRWIERHRVSIRTLMDAINPEEGSMRSGWDFLGVTSGYYYYNEVYRREGIEVILEASSYIAHQEAMQSGVLQKLVFHSTGELCGDWVPNSQWIGNYAEVETRPRLCNSSRNHDDTVETGSGSCGPTRNHDNDDDKLRQRYLSLLQEPLSSEDMSHTEVWVRDARFREQHAISEASVVWPTQLEEPSPELLRALASDPVASELLQVTGVLPISARPALPKMIDTSCATHVVQEQVVQKFQKLVSVASEGAIWAWMGVAPLVAQHVLHTGSVEALRSEAGTTQGTIGAGVYMSLQAHYAALYATGRLGYRAVSPTEYGYCLLFCRVWPGVIYPVTRQLDYTGLSQHPGRSVRCDFWGKPLRSGVDSHVGIVSADTYWQVTEDPQLGDVAELVVAAASQIEPFAVVFFRVSDSTEFLC